MHRAVAVDLGATSGRFALGTLAEGVITYEIIEQIPHEAVKDRGLLRWDLDLLLGLCRRGLDVADQTQAGSIAIDSWGVDHGFLDQDGNLMAAPVCYRDDSNTRAFERLTPYRERLYELTGVQHQPFNTICQLVARKEEDPDLPQKARGWMILPDLLGYLLGGPLHHEITQASTTQLLGLDSRWSEEAFQIAGWHLPGLQPSLPGNLGPTLQGGVRLAYVGSHDTASAVAGFGALADDQMFVNVGTWSLAGVLLDLPIATKEAELAQFTNERAIDGRVRFLKNIPGFYFINRLHKDLGVASTVPEWLANSQNVDEGVDLLLSELYNPPSMLEACCKLCRTQPRSEAEWAGFALRSLAEAISSTARQLEKLTCREIRSIRVGGGGSQSSAFCQTLAGISRKTILAGPAEVTVLGNLAAQFLAQGAFPGWPEAFSTIVASSKVARYV